jgi:FKBP-type peptidyl-prolyl cis-trans isomerase FklB
MKKYPILIAGIALASSALTSCLGDDENTWDTYREWREANNTWLEEQIALTEDGSTEPYYHRVVPAYNLGSYVYMHWYNDRQATAGNLVPFSTSTVSVKYIGRLYDDTAFDSSYLQTDSVLSVTVNSDIIDGWQIALQEMHVGDSCEVIIPYQFAYGSSGYNTISPYSNLKFNMKLVDLTAYEIKSDE